MMNKRVLWVESLGVYLKPRMLAVCFLGISSGLPLLLTASTLFARFKEGGVDLGTIGLFSLLAIPYSIKFLWAPFVDQIRIFYLCRVLGHRRSWALVSQLCLMGCIWGMGVVNVGEEVWLLGLLALLTSFFSSLQDIVIDALRVEMLEDEEQAAGAASLVTGYRIGMLLTGAGALALAGQVGWDRVYQLSSLLMLVGVGTIFFIKENPRENHEEREGWDISTWLRHSIVEPFVEFFRRDYALLILFFIAFFKLGDALAGAMSMPFYLDLGFSKESIAGITKVFGLGATLFGAFLGGVLVRRWGLLKSLLICGILQLLSNFAFVWLSYVGEVHSVLVLVIAVENISGGMGTAAFVGYMSSLCHKEFTATQYALLSSLSSVGRTVLSSSTGYLAESLGWSNFFIFSAIAAVPGLLLLFRIHRLLD